MYLSGTYLGLSYFSKANPLPIPTTYSRISFFGDCIIDNVWVQDRILTDAEINAMTVHDDITWTSHTLLLAKFDNSLDGGNIKSLLSPIESWDIYRRNTDDNILKKLGNVDAAVTDFIDLTTQAYKNYIYEVFPLTATEIGVALESDPIYTDYYGYFLIDEYEGVAYKFDFNISSTDFQYEEDVTTYKTYTKYPAVTRGRQNYLKHSITALAGTIACPTGEFVQPIDYINELERIITNGKEKIYKTRKGGIYRVYTTNFRYKVLEDGITEQPMLISFDIIEIREV